MKASAKPALDTAMARPGVHTIVILPRSQAVGLLCVAHLPTLGGAERSLLELVDELVSDHWIFCAVVCPSEGALPARLRARGAAVLIAPLTWWCEPGRHRHSDDTWLAAGLTALLAVTPRLRAINPDIVWTQTMVIPWGALAAQILERPHVWSVCEYGERDHDLRFACPFGAVIAFIGRQSDFVFANSTQLLNALFAGLDQSRVDVLHRHIKLDRAEVRRLGRSEHPWKRSTSFRLVVVGAIHKGKGQEDVIRALAVLRRQGRDVELALVGSWDDSYRAVLDALIAEEQLDDVVTFRGFQDEPYAIVLAADAVVSCARSEAFGRVVVEAMLLERPIVYTAAGGHLDYMVDGETGLAYQPGDIEGLADRIARLVDDRDLGSRLGATASERARQLFTPDRYGGKVAHRLRDLTRRRGSYPLAAVSNDSLRSLAALGTRTDRIPMGVDLPEGKAELEAGHAIEAENASLRRAETEMERRHTAAAGNLAERSAVPAEWRNPPLWRLTAALRSIPGAARRWMAGLKRVATRLRQARF
ncbi:MAG: glycosyltransferase [Xanthobacteraceae bacterium]